MLRMLSLRTPCALGAIINDETVPRLKARIVAGAANNQLADSQHGQALTDLGILYAPDYVLNAGGVIRIASEGPTIDEADVPALIEGIEATLMEIFTRAEAKGPPESVKALHTCFRFSTYVDPVDGWLWQHTHETCKGSWPTMMFQRRSVLESE